MQLPAIAMLFSGLLLASCDARCDRAAVETAEHDLTMEVRPLLASATSPERVFAVVEVASRRHLTLGRPIPIVIKYDCGEASLEVASNDRLWRRGPVRFDLTTDSSGPKAAKEVSTHSREEVVHVLAALPPTCTGAHVRADAGGSIDVDLRAGSATLP